MMTCPVVKPCIVPTFHRMNVKGGSALEVETVAETCCHTPRYSGNGRSSGVSDPSADERGPQSVQSVPRSQVEYSEPGPPSSHLSE